MAGRKPHSVIKTLKNKDVLDLFSNSISVTDPNSVKLPVAHEKYSAVERNCARFLSLIHVFNESEVPKKAPDLASPFVKYYSTLLDGYSKAFAAPALEPYLGDNAENYGEVPEDIREQFMKVYAELKETGIVNECLVVCNNLTKRKKYIADKKTLSASFLTRTAGIAYCPFEAAPNFNLKALYIDGRLGASDKKMVLVLLHKAYEITYDVYKAISKADIDVDEFSRVVRESIAAVRKQPGLSRCGDAFDKIIESVGMFKGNFDEYYQDYVVSSNPGVIMENFINDVSKNTKSSTKLTSQFKDIIKYYRKAAGQQQSDPRLASLFKEVDSNFRELESRHRGEKDPEDSEGSDLDEDCGGGGGAGAAAE